MQSLESFIAAHKIKMDATEVVENKNMVGGLTREARHYECTLYCRGRRMTTYYSMGKRNYEREPEIKDVLSCMASDSASVEASPKFEDWASDLGWDSDSRSAERVFKGCRLGAQKLKRLLRDEETYRDLLYKTERD